AARTSAVASTTAIVGGQPVVTTAPSCGTATSGKAFTCTTTTSGGTAPYTYTWTLPVACTGTSTTSSISVTCSPKGSYSISVVARDGNAVNSASASTTAVVAGQPVVNNVSCGIATVGKAFTCTAATSGGTPGYTYTWTLPAACTGTSTTNSISVTCSP